MPLPPNVVLPKLADHQAFERLCRALLNARFPEAPPTQLFGRNGQQQHGLDSIVRHRSGIGGYQMKHADCLRISVVREELARSKAFTEPLTTFTVLTTMDNDARLQEEVLALSRLSEAQGGPVVDVVFWDTITEWVLAHEEVLSAHFQLPGLTAHVDAVQARLGRAFPGTRMTISTANARREVTVHAGPGGIPFALRLTGPDVLKRLNESVDSGQPLTLRAREFNLILPRELAPLGFTTSGCEEGELTITPQFGSGAVRVRVVVEPQERHHSMEMFTRRRKHSLDGFKALMKPIRAGRREGVFDFEFEDLPLSARLEVVERGDERHCTMQFACDLEGKPVHLASCALHVIRDFSRGAYLGIFGHEQHPIVATVKSGDDVDVDLVDEIDVFVRLQRVTGWDLRFGGSFTDEDLAEAEAITALFDYGKRTVRSGGTYEWTSGTDEELAGIRHVMTDGIPPFSIAVTCNARDVIVMGQAFQHPATRLVLPNVTVEFLDPGSPDQRTRVKVVVADDAEVIEYLGEADR